MALKKIKRKPVRKTTEGEIPPQRLAKGDK
jgi:hypothetical protein